jgi:hypothetical protein
MKKTISGQIYNRIEKMGDKDYRHIGFEDPKGEFPLMLESLVPKVGDIKKVKVTVEIIEDKNNDK